jgi:hypothetical protein
MGHTSKFSYKTASSAVVYVNLQVLAVSCRSANRIRFSKQYGWQTKTVTVFVCNLQRAPVLRSGSQPFLCYRYGTGFQLVCVKHRKLVASNFSSRCSSITSYLMNENDTKLMNYQKFASFQRESMGHCWKSCTTVDDYNRWWPDAIAVINDTLSGYFAYVTNLGLLCTVHYSCRTSQHVRFVSWWLPLVVKWFLKHINFSFDLKWKQFYAVA